jgi:hypothetical protein
MQIFTAACRLLARNAHSRHHCTGDPRALALGRPEGHLVDGMSGGVA